MLYYFVSFLPRHHFLSILAKPSTIFFLIVALLFGSANTRGAGDSAGKLRKQAQKAARGGDFVLAENLWQEILRVEPEDNESRLALSYTLYKQRKWLPSFNEAARVEENLRTKKTNLENFDKKTLQSARVRALIGSIYLQAGRFEEARPILKAVLQLNPNEALALASDAMIDFYENRSKISLIKLRRAVYIESDEPDFVFAQAQIAARAEFYKEAAESYERFLHIAPETDVDRRERIKGLIAFLRYLSGIKSLYAPGNKRETRVTCETVNNRPVIEVRINNYPKPFRFVLDTGSGMTVVSDETADLLGIKEIARGGLARAVGGGGKFEVVYGFLDSLNIGDVQIERVPIYIRKFNQNSDTFDGYLGLSVIAKFIATLDYSAKTFALKRNAFDKRAQTQNLAAPAVLPDDAFQIPLRTTSSGFLSSEVKIDRIEDAFNFIIDTGASISVVSAETAKRAEFNEFLQPTTLRVFGAAGIAENVSTLLLPRLTLGNLSRERLSAAILDLQPINETAGFEQAGILGGNFLQHYRLTFNFQNSIVTFEPTAAKKSPPRANQINNESLLK